MIEKKSKLQQVLRPTFRQMLKLSPEMIEYVLGGGLILKTHLK